MNHKARIIAFAALLAVIAAPALRAGAEDLQARDEKAFQDIKLLIFDEKWADAEARLFDFLGRYPQSAYAPQALYYKGKCLEEMGGRDKDALQAYKAYLQIKDRNKNLAEDAEISIVDLALKFYDAGERAYLRDMEDRLDSRNKVVKYYAAVQMSKSKDRRLAERTIPILLTIARGESNADLRDRAKIALLRLSPESLSQVEGRPVFRRHGTLHFEVVDEGLGKVLFSIAIPKALADLALSAVPEEEMQAVRLKGYDIPKILRELETSGRSVLEIRSEGKSIKIWID
jgi:tetratricopeptide (TPR) repeat protein